MQDAPQHSRRQTDVMDPARAQALGATLGIDLDLSQGLPPFFHQIYFWEALSEPDLGLDGHPRVGERIPDMGLPRRMWAGGRLNWQRSLMAGITAEKRTRVESQTHKQGRSGALGFVTLRHEIWQSGVLCLTEWQDLVYRGEGAGGTPPQARTDAEVTTRMTASTTELFRYSALTFNGHRIHYDLDYATGTEGYAGLVVHGPLLAQRLMLLAAERGPLRAFEFRATAPLMHFETATLCQNGSDLWVAGPDGRQCMTAKANWR